ncbi:MAG: hypothetical protein ACI3U2_09490, partial [Anaerovibrio sp.]
PFFQSSMLITAFPNTKVVYKLIVQQNLPKKVACHATFGNFFRYGHIIFCRVVAYKTVLFIDGLS